MLLKRMLLSERVRPVEKNDLTVEWEKAAREAAEILSVEVIPAYPELSKPPLAASTESSGKRKSPEPEEDDGKKKRKSRGKKGKKDEEEGDVPPPPPADAPPAAAAAHAAQAALALSFMSVFDTASLTAPVFPDKDEMGKILLERRKAALREEYGV